MRCQAHIDVRHDQQLESSLLRSKQNDRDENDVCANAKRIQEDIKCRTHIDAKYDQQFRKSLRQLR